jgi:hypothetical protein
MLSDFYGKRPPQKGPFWKHFLNNSMNFWFWANKNILAKIWSKPKLLMCLPADSGKSRSFYNFVKFKKSGIFICFGQIWQLFFQNTILGKIGPKTIENEFVIFFRS